MTKNTTAEIKKFKANYAKIKTSIKELKKKLVALKKEATPIVKAAYKLYKHGDKTMYHEKDGRPMFDSLPNMMDNLDLWMGLDYDIMQAIENTL